MGLLMVGGGMTPDQDESHVRFVMPAPPTRAPRRGRAPHPPPHPPPPLPRCAQRQLALWAITATKLLISVDPRHFNNHSLSLVSNPEIIAIDQDARKLQGQRVIPPVNAARSAADWARIRAWKRANLEGGSWRAAGRSMELLLGGPDAGAVPGMEQDELLAAGGRPEVWQRELAPAPGETSAWALLLFNNGGAAGLSVDCSGACWARMGFAAGAAVRVRDVIARTDNGTATGGLAVGLRTNATALLRLAL